MPTNARKMPGLDSPTAVTVAVHMVPLRHWWVTRRLKWRDMAETNEDGECRWVKEADMKISRNSRIEKRIFTNKQRKSRCGWIRHQKLNQAGVKWCKWVKWKKNRNEINLKKKKKLDFNVVPGSSDKLTKIHHSSEASISFPPTQDACVVKMKACQHNHNGWEINKTWHRSYQLSEMYV